MKRVIFAAFTILLCVLVSCKIEPEQINYGSDACAFCKMTIVDQQHAAQYVSNKGKQFKFDAIECMVNAIAEKGSEDIELFLVADYQVPGSMINAKEATYLISKEIKSPMGANLSGFASKEKALVTQKDSGGDIYTWQELLIKFDAE